MDITLQVFAFIAIFIELNHYSDIEIIKSYNIINIIYINFERI